MSIGADNPILSIVRDRLAAWLGRTHNGNRDLYESFGWTKVVLKEQLFAMYGRNGVANRIIRLYPQATWRDKPVIQDEQGDNPAQGHKNYSAFAEAAEKLFKDHRIYHFLERGDRVSTIGQFGCVLLGFNDGLDLRQPLGEAKAKLLYIQPYSELNITINTIDDDPKSARFGKPLTYTLQTGGMSSQGLISSRRSVTAHWSRVIHMAENLDEDNVYGIPRLLPIYNYLQDLDKLLGASTETFWLNARAGLSLEADKDANINQTQLDAARAQAVEYEHQLRRIFALQGMKANVLNAATDDPSPTISGLMDAISGGSGIPKRILMGSERGELASSQDENNWAQRTEERRQSFAMPSVLEPLIVLLIKTGNLPQPKGEWWVEWGGKSLTPEQQSQVGGAMSTTLRNYLMTPGADIVVPVSEFREKFLGLSPNPDPADDELDLSQELIDLKKEEAESQAEVQKESLEHKAGLDAEVQERDIAAKKEAGAEAAAAEEAEAAEKAAAEEQERLRANAKVAPLYVCRKVLNANEILTWAERQGFDNLVPASELHVTVLYSKSNVNWIDMGQDCAGDQDGCLTIKPGGPRVVEMFGDCLVLSFASGDLLYRHQELLAKGASSDYPDFCPHITLSVEGGLGDLDLMEVTPYAGEIILGPEVFEELNPNWKIELVEAD